MLYNTQGHYAKAEPLYQRALAIWKSPGAGAPRYRHELNNLALSYDSQGHYAKAEPLYQRRSGYRRKSPRAGAPRYRQKSQQSRGDVPRQGLYAKAEPLARRGLTVEFTLIQREAPYLPVAERQSFLQTFGYTYEIAFSSAQRGSNGANLALFSRLNRQGLLQEIEQRQAQLASLPGPQQALASELRAVTQQLASMALSPEQRQQLKGRQEELEKQLYRLLPQLQPRVVEVQQVAAALPAGSALIEFQRYRPFDGTKPQRSALGGGPISGPGAQTRWRHHTDRSGNRSAH